MSNNQVQNPLALKTVETPDAFVNLRADGIVHVHFKADSVFTLDVQVSLRKIYSDLVGGTPTGFIFSAEEGLTVSKEARDNFSKLPLGNPIKAYGIVAINLAYRLVANFFLKFYSPQIPVKLFETVDEAATWLLAMGYANK